MKHYHTFLYSTCALALGALMTACLSGCTADELVDEPGTVPSELGDVTVIASLGQGVGTRTGHEEANPDDPRQGIKVTWAPGDDIKIINSTISSTTTFTFAGITADGKGIFKGKAEPENGSNKIIYPARVTIREDGNLHFDMTGQTQWGDGSMAHLGAYDVMKQSASVSDWSSFPLSFPAYSHLNALMTFDLTGIPADLGRPQSITLGCTSTAPVFNNNTEWYRGITYVPTFELKLTGFATPADDTTVDIKAYLMMAKTTIPAGESLIITVRGTKNSYTFTSAAMAAKKVYESAKRYTASVGAGQWTKVFSGDTYTGTETAEAFTGSGSSAADPYLIGTAGQLRTLIEGVKTNSGYEDKFFKLTTDIRIAMADAGVWTPIGYASSMFKGNFDGDGHTISGALTSASSNFGFFGYTNGATITNLTVDATVSGGSNVGGIVGYASASTRISHCTNLGAITVTVTSGFGGGIAGTLNSSCILGCVNQGAVLGQVGQFFGGIAGLAANKSSVIACYNTGKIARADNSITNIGTIAGNNQQGCTVSYCQWVPDAANAGLPAFPTGNAGTSTENTVRANLAALNAAGVAALNEGIKAWNTANAANAAGTANHCAFHFVAGTTAGPTLAAGAPN